MLSGGLSSMKAGREWVATPEDLTGFTRRLSAAMRFGVPLAQAVEMCSEEVKNPCLKQAIRRVRNLVAEGATLSQALSREPSFFPPSYVETISRAEKIEGLPSALKHLAEELEERAATRNLVRRLERYPVIVAFWTLSIVVLSVFLLMPTGLLPLRGFKEIWQGFDTTLPATGWVFFWIVGTFLVDRAVEIVLIACSLLSLISLDALLLRLSPPGRLIVDRRKLRSPLYGRSMRCVNSSILCDALGRRLQCGSTLSEALDRARRLVPSPVFKEEVSKLGRQLQAGSTLSEAMKRSKWFPFALIQAVASSESRGQLPTSLVELANSYREESEYSVQRMGRWASAWVASLSAVCLLFPALTFLVTIVTNYEIWRRIITVSFVL
jgi:general secretion pathway protein F